MTEQIMKQFSRLWKPHAYAQIRGSEEEKNICGCIHFYQRRNGVLIVTEFNGLPCTQPCSVFGFHIHNGEMCRGNENDSFADAGMHLNPNQTEHPCHAGDMPPIFGNDGYAFQAFFTNRIKVCEIIGKTVILHSSADDFTTQPAGNSGRKIACGKIQKVF